MSYVSKTHVLWAQIGLRSFFDLRSAGWQVRSRAFYMEELSNNMTSRGTLTKKPVSLRKLDTNLSLISWKAKNKNNSLMNYKFFVPLTLTLMIESTRRLNSPFYMALVQQQKIIAAGSRISLHLTVRKKRCVQKTST